VHTGDTDAGTLCTLVAQVCALAQLCTLTQIRTCIAPAAVACGCSAGERAALCTLVTQTLNHEP
jgi:hypothetical protein